MEKHGLYQTEVTVKVKVEHWEQIKAESVVNNIKLLLLKQPSTLAVDVVNQRTTHPVSEFTNLPANIIQIDENHFSYPLDGKNENQNN